MRLVFFGCSHTYNCLWKCFDVDGIKVLNKSMSGNSNQKIFDDVYQYINSTEYSTNDILIIQYTYTNRLWWPNKLDGNHVSFHSFDTDNSPIYYLNKFCKEELLSLYTNFIKYFWNYDTAFRTHKMNIDLLKSYLESKGVNFIHWMYSDGGNTKEWNIGFKTFWKKNDDISVFQSLNLFSIDGFYRIQDWAIENKFTDKADHINEKGNYILSVEMCKLLKKKFNFSIEPIEIYNIENRECSLF